MTGYGVTASDIDHALDMIDSVVRDYRRRSNGHSTPSRDPRPTGGSKDSSPPSRTDLGVCPQRKSSFLLKISPGINPYSQGQPLRHPLQLNTNAMGSFTPSFTAKFDHSHRRTKDTNAGIHPPLAISHLSLIG